MDENRILIHIESGDIFLTIKILRKVFTCYVHAAKLRKEITEIGTVVCWRLSFLSFYEPDCYKFDK